MNEESAQRMLWHNPITSENLNFADSEGSYFEGNGTDTVQDIIDKSELSVLRKTYASLVPPPISKCK